MSVKNLYKTTIVIWTGYDLEGLTEEDLGHEADQGAAFCSKRSSRLIEDPVEDTDWVDTDFFDEFGEP
jgi:hypothetical protein